MAKNHYVGHPGFRVLTGAHFPYIVVFLIQAFRISLLEAEIQAIKIELCDIRLYFCLGDCSKLCSLFGNDIYRDAVIVLLHNKNLQPIAQC